MDWINVKDRLPEDGTPVLMSEPVPTWGAEPDGSGVLLLGIFKDGRFQVDRPPSYEAKPTRWVAVTLPE